MATLSVYQFGVGKVADLEPLDGDWLHRANEHGAGRVLVNGDVAAALLAADTYVRVNDGTRDVFAFYPTGKPRAQAGRGSEVRLSGPGMLWLLTRALVYPEESCRPVNVRWFGPMSAVYVPDVDWISPVSHGRHDAFPFGEDRGDGMADRAAELISYTTSQNLNATEFDQRVEFTLSEDTDVVIQVYADDFYRAWLDAAPVDELQSPQQPYNWDKVQTWSGRLCAGDHVLYLEVGNLDANVAGANPVYVCWSVMNVSGNGKPAASHHAVNITHNHTSGQWIGIFDGQATAAIDFDATTDAVETAFNDVVGDGEVTVTGSPGAYVITADGPTTGYTPHVITAQENTLSGGSLSVTVATYGASADYIVHSDTSTGVVLPPGSGTKGLTPHEIVATLKAEEEARGDTLLSNLTLGTTATLDVDGNTWGQVVLEVGLDGANIGRVIEMLVEAGTKWDVTPDLTVQGWATRGTDRSATVVYTAGDGADIVTAGSDTSGLTNVIRALTEDGWIETSDATSIATHGRSGATIRLDTYDEDGAGQFTPQFLADLKEPQEPVELLVPAEHPVLPYDDFQMADVVTMDAWGASGFVATPVRVLEIGGRLAGRSHDWMLRGTT